MPASRRRPRRAWTRYTDEALLEMRLCDLDLRLERTPLERRVEQLYDELERRGIRFKPHTWLSSEWFSPDGVPGIAIPFYLAHPRLQKLEKRKMFECEGGSASSCMRVLRHEAGHALCTAYRLHYRKRWRKMFGRYSEPYPKYYRPKPASRSHVLHLSAWYAQAHPAEDFAETFAVWLTPRSNWRRRYAEWPRALAKLEYVDEVMGEIAGTAPKVRSRAKVDPVHRLKTTLEEHYRWKRELYGAQLPEAYDRDLKRLFSSDRRYAHRPTAGSYLRSMRAEIRSTVAEWTGAHPYTVDQVLRDMIDRCRSLKLRLAQPRAEAKTQAVILLTVHTMNCLLAAKHEIAV